MGFREIKKDDEIVFGYMSTKENPADVATKGTAVHKLVDNHLWWYGPRWLTGPKSEWQAFPNERDEQTDLEYASEIKKPKSVKRISLLAAHIPEQSTYHSDACTPLGIKCEAYSSVTKMLRVTALALRFINKLRDSNGRRGPLLSSEIDTAEIMWLTYLQERNFSDVYDAITQGKKSNLQKQLGLYLDDDGLLRCKGRIDQAEISESARRPILLPKNE